MGAPDLLRHLRGAGFTLTLADGGIRVAPARQLTDDQRQAIRDHRVELLTLLRLADPAALVKAINACCDARGDDDNNRAGLITECTALDAAGQADMREHFETEALIWQRAARGGRP
ncbi:MAG: hypothetical protein JNL87_01110 [Burkholderiaceae bacterium]|nr:hypothetical protein [Burkholderiaceae bacterium]